MPRLNDGTLLENLVVLEVTRALATNAEMTVEFASAFAMPPLTECWHGTQHEPRNNPSFNANVMDGLLSGALTAGGPLSFSALLRDCLLNAQHLPIVPYAQTDAHQRCECGGPNGALLAALLVRRQHGQAIRIWSNDLAGPTARYRGATGAPDASTECPRTNEYASALSTGAGGLIGVDACCDRAFPSSITALAAWRGSCAVRIGFLDPDSYTADRVPGPGQVDCPAHVRWLTNLHHNALCTAGVMFFASQDRPGRPALIQAFHNDAVGDYHHSVVFTHGNYMVGVKLRCPDENTTRLIIASVRNAWGAWATMLGRRQQPDKPDCWVDGQEQPQ